MNGCCVVCDAPYEKGRMVCTKCGLVYPTETYQDPLVGRYGGTPHGLLVRELMPGAQAHEKYKRSLPGTSGTLIVKKEW